MYTHYLRKGDLIDLSTWTDVTYADYKSDLKGQEYYATAVTSGAIFAGDYTGQPGELEYVATNLLDRFLLHN